MLYTIVHTVINNKGEHPEANARVLGYIQMKMLLLMKRKNGLRIQRLLT